MDIADRRFSDSPEKAFLSRMEPTTRRRLGQFFTPYPIARFMAQWVVADPFVRTILDPAVGLGVFFRAAAEVAERELQFVGYDLDENLLDEASHLFAGWLRVTLRRQDFLHNDWGNLFEGILCNPPYQRFHHYSERSRIFAEFRDRLHLPLSGSTNLYVLFLLKAVRQLKENGRAAFIIPSEFMNATYGKLAKGFLLDSGALRYVFVFDFDTNVFEGALTTACVLLFARDRQPFPVEFRRVRSVEELTSLGSVLLKYPEAPPVGYRVFTPDPQKKWRLYYQMLPSPRSELSSFCSMGSCGRVIRGIATGHNAFFTLSEPRRRELGIHERFLLPCLTRATYAPFPLFTSADFARLRDEGKRVWLLNAGDASDEAVRTYLRYGESIGVHERYLTQHRRPWYALENRKPAPILVTVFGRGGIRFVRNKADVFNLTCFHGWHLQGFDERQVDLLMAYLITDFAQEILAFSRREYGDGLEKFEPGDLNEALVLHVGALPPGVISEALRLYNAYLHTSEEALRRRLDVLFRRAAKLF